MESLSFNWHQSPGIWRYRDPISYDIDSARGIRLIPDTVGAVRRQGCCVPTNWCRFISCLFRPRRRELPEYYSTSDCAPGATRCIINLKLYCARERELAHHAERPCRGLWSVCIRVKGRGVAGKGVGGEDGGGDGVTAIREKHCRRNTAVVPFPDLTCGIVPRMVLRSCSPCLPSRRHLPKLLWLMHFAWVLDPICMHHARKSGTKLNCRYIVPQDVGPGDTNKSSRKSRPRNRRTYDERLNNLESARVPVFFSLSFMHVIRAASQTFPQFRIRVRSMNRSVLSSDVQPDSELLHKFFSPLTIR